MTDTIAALYMYSGVSFGSNLLQSDFQETKYCHPRGKVEEAPVPVTPGRHGRGRRLALSASGFQSPRTRLQTDVR